MSAARSRARAADASATTTAPADDAVARAFGARVDARSNGARAKRKHFASTAGRETVAAERARAIPKGEACDALPMDWTIKSSVRLSSRARSFRWGTCVGANATSEGLRAYSGGDASSLGIGAGKHDDDDDDENGGLENKQKVLTRAMYSCTYPELGLSDEQLASMRATESGCEWVRKRESMWVDALVSLYGLLKVRQCYAFYVIYRERSILFCAPGVGGVTDGGYAVVTNSNTKIRMALKDAAVDFTSADEEALAIGKAKTAWAQKWRPENDAPALLDDLAGDDASRAEITAQLAKMDKPSNARRRAADTIICRGAIAVNGLLNVLVEASGGDPGHSDGTPHDVPTLLAPVPFAHSSMKPLELKVQTNTMLSRKDGKSSSILQQASKTPSMEMVYTAETDRDELIPPWTLARVCAALALNHEDISATCITHKPTYGLNVGVLAARDMSDSNTKHREEVLVRECAYYDEAETSRIMAPPPLGSSALTRIEYVNGTYYIP